MKAIYVRQSLDKKDSISVETQIDECIVKVGTASYKVYSDKGYSGKNTSRPGFKEMMADLTTGAIDQIIVYKLDRISRNVVDFVNMHETFTKHGASFISCKEGFDSSTQLGRLLMMMLISFAQFERESIQERVKDNYYSRGSKGLYMGGRAPYGFNKIETHHNGIKTYTFEENSEQASYVRMMYEKYAYTDMSLGQLSRYLNELNVLSAEEKRWDNSKISRILRSPVYVKADSDVYTYYKNKGCNVVNSVEEFIGTNGCYLYGKREANERKYTDVTDHYLSIGLHEGLVDSETWLLVQYKLDSNKQIKNSGRGTHTFLTGLLKCRKCGYSVAVASSYNGKTYLACKGKYTVNACTGFTKTVQVAEIEKIATIKIKQKVEQMRRWSFQMEDGNTRQKINDLKARLVSIDEQIANLIEGLANGNTVVLKYINAKLDALDAEKTNTENEMKKIMLEENRRMPIDSYLDKIEKWDELEFEDKKQVCKALMDRVLIFDNDIDIEWKF
jgi:DNA invertase Pin-like site-specific DNA recombinase